MPRFAIYLRAALVRLYDDAMPIESISPGFMSFTASENYNASVFNFASIYAQSAAPPAALSQRRFADSVSMRASAVRQEEARLRGAMAAKITPLMPPASSHHACSPPQ